MIKVLHVLPGLGGGGAEQMVVSLTQALNRERFEAEVITLLDPPFGTDLEDFLVQNGIPVWHLGKRQGFDPRAFVRLARVVDRVKPHVLHTHTYGLRYALPCMLRRRAPAMIHTIHTLAEREMDWSGRLIYGMAFRRAVLPVAIAEEVADGLRSVYGIDDFPLIPNGIPVDNFRQPSVGPEEWRRAEGFAPQDVLFVCVAGLRPVKNPVLLLESFVQGLASDSRAHLLFVGNGELRSDLERQIDALGVQEKVHLLGRRSDVPEILNAADVFVLNSDWEGNPLSVMEAMAAGKPVVCTAVGGIPELVEDGECGLLVPPGDAKALTEAMGYMLENSEARASMGGASARRAEVRFDLKAMTEAYEKLYTAVIKEARPSWVGAAG